jgi:osmotically-inducible protein OsmY
MMAPWLAMAQTTSAADEARRADLELAKKVRHEIVMLPFLSVFDNISFRVDNGVVTLDGHVSRPTLQTGAERVAAKVEGVRVVVNNIEVLPLSNFDDRIRLGVLNAVYGFPALQRYGMGTQPSIRIVVKNGEVFLEGVVNNEADRNLANIRANGVFGVFQVHNNLRVATDRKA